MLKSLIALLLACFSSAPREENRLLPPEKIHRSHTQGGCPAFLYNAKGKLSTILSPTNAGTLFCLKLDLHESLKFDLHEIWEFEIAGDGASVRLCPTEESTFTYTRDTACPLSLYNLKNGVLLAQTKTPHAFSDLLINKQNGWELISASKDGSVIVWKVDLSTKCISPVRTLRTPDSSSVRCLEQYQNRVFIGLETGDIESRDLETGKLIWQIKTERGPVCCLTVIGCMLVAIVGTGTPLSWSLDLDYRCERTFECAPWGITERYIVLQHGYRLGCCNLVVKMHPNSGFEPINGPPFGCSFLPETSPETTNPWHGKLT